MSPQPKVAKAARAELNGQSKTVEIDGEKFKLPPELPFAFAAYLQEGELLNAARGLFEPEDIDRFMRTRVSLQGFADAIEEAYGLKSGG